MYIPRYIIMYSVSTFVPESPVHDDLFLSDVRQTVCFLCKNKYNCDETCASAIAFISGSVPRLVHYFKKLCNNHGRKSKHKG